MFLINLQTIILYHLQLKAKNLPSWKLWSTVNGNWKVSCKEKKEKILFTFTIPGKGNCSKWARNQKLGEQFQNIPLVSSQRDKYPYMTFSLKMLSNLTINHKTFMAKCAYTVQLKELSFSFTTWKKFWDPKNLKTQKSLKIIDSSTRTSQACAPE